MAYIPTHIEIKKIRKRLGKNQKCFSDIIGKSRASYVKKELGSVPFFPDEIEAILIEGYKSIPASEMAEILYGVGAEAMGAPSREYGPFPHISYAAAGDACEAVDNWQPGVSGEGDWQRSAVKAGPRSFWLTIKGGSMEPYLPDGFLALIDPDKPVMTGDPCLVRIGENEVTMKFWNDNGNEIRLIPANVEGGYETRIFKKEFAKERLCPIGRIVDVKIKTMPSLRHRNGD